MATNEHGYERNDLEGEDIAVRQDDQHQGGPYLLLPPL